MDGIQAEVFYWDVRIDGLKKEDMRMSKRFFLIGIAMTFIAAFVWLFCMAHTWLSVSEPFSTILQILIKIYIIIWIAMFAAAILTYITKK